MKTLTLALIGLVVGLTGCGGDDSPSGVAGSYSLDQDHMESVMGDVMKSQIPDFENALPAVKEQAKKAAMAQMANMTMVLDLKSDETFTIKGNMMGDTIDGAGTYVLADGKITLTTTHDKGKKIETPKSEDAITATIQDGVIEFTPPGAPMSFKLRK
ncbi:MAG: hypothetical protein KDB53_07880 [Planctomycetes bacterium]|nr:hypothetical protein [Planctomycetota bacterium]